MKKKPSRAHGAAVEAPPEEFALSESPEPAKVGENVRSVRPPLARRSLGAKLLGGLKLLCGLAVVIATSVAVAYSVHRYAVTTARFALKEVELVGAKRLTAAQIEKLGGLTRGTNLFAVDAEAAERKILENPWVSSVRITRELPNGLKVELGERDAVAVAAVGDRLYLVTSQGEPFKNLEVEDPSDLPVITGITAEDLSRDRARALERLRAGIDLLRQYEKQPASRVHPVEEVHVAPSGDFVLTVGRDGIALELGKPPFARKLAMADEVLASMRKKGRSPGVVFLDNQAHPERVVVRMK